MIEDVYFLALKFRKALEQASLAGEFDNDSVVGKFPVAWCGVASSLLAKYLFDHGIYTYEVSGTNYTDHQSHMWLQLLNGDIVDITGDQFKNKVIYNNYSMEVYVGPMDDFHKLFI